ncbi:hypothetical protein EII18_07730 [Comamonadaceae bacterium OH3737_COT-264]|uniref:hypothetical protein n=1 Tax=Allofranklinella schreckenbergeri TaxID=1076744 RepID=UPI000F5DA993|nr:hypothetical protein [Allofranklinella schreckenbergeri]RRD41763.1 hypothetical protein EII18_07730 [Comamonadaceae bacterium OH3737_COT-264]
MENPLIGKSFRWFSDSNGADSSGSNFHSAILSGFRSGSSESRSFLCRKIIIHFHSADRVSLNFDFDHEEDEVGGGSDFNYVKFDFGNRKFIGFIDFESDGRWEDYGRYWIFELSFNENFSKIEEGRIFIRDESKYEDLSSTKTGAFVDVGFAEKMVEFAEKMERLKKEMESMKGNMGF